VLIGTARPLSPSEPLWRSGFGFADAPAALAVVQREDAPAAARAAAARAVRRVQDARPWRVRVADTLQYAPLPASVAGVDTRSLRVDVAPGTDALHVLLRHPSDDASGANDYVYDLEVRDAAGVVMARRSSEVFSGAVTAVVALDPRRTSFGAFTFEVAARLGTTGDGDAIGNRVLLIVSQLEASDPRARGSPRSRRPASCAPTSSRVLLCQARPPLRAAR
jgi:hypothetical protein